MKRILIPVFALMIALISGCKITDGPGPGDLKDLEGSWIRIGGNNPSNDGMIVKMDGTSGTITDAASSGFSNGGIKWKDIEAVDDENYLYEELGSDGNYYSATMELRSDDTLRINVVSSGAGNIQKWVREGEYIPGQGPTTTEILKGSISEDRILKNGPAAVDYRVQGVLDITAGLTIEPGVTIAFEENAGLGVYDAGYLNAAGTSTEGITLTGTTHNQGWWRGVHIETNSSNNILNFVTFEDAGSNYVYCCNVVASLFLKGAKIKLNNVSMSNGGANGLYADGNADITEFSAVTITSHVDYPVYIHPEAAGALDGSASDYTGNDKDFVYVTGSSIDDATTWKANNVPYLMDGDVFNVTAAFTLEAGVEVEMEENAGIGVYDGGSFAVNGTSSEPVVIRGKEGIRGYWRGIHIETNTISNSINYLNLSDAGSNYVYCCNEIGSFYLKSGKASIRNSTISNGDSYGIVARDEFEFSAYENNTVTTHTKAPLLLDPENLSSLDGRDSDYTGNDEDVIRVTDASVSKATTWYPTNVPYLVEGVVDITKPLVIEAGADITFAENAGLGIYDEGTFNAEGSSTEKIIFRGADNVQGYWRGIHTETNSSNNVMRYVELRNAGSNYVYCCNDKANLYIKSGQMTLENSSVTDGGGCGVVVRSGATFNETGNTYSNNATGDVCD